MLIDFCKFVLSSITSTTLMSVAGRTLANPPLTSFVTLRRDAIEAAIKTLATKTLVGFGDGADRYVDNCLELAVHSYDPVLTLGKTIADRRILVFPLERLAVNATTFIKVYTKALGSLQSISAEQCYECVQSSFSAITELDLGILQSYYFPRYCTLIPTITGVALEELLKKTGLRGSVLCDTLRETFAAVGCGVVGSMVGPGPVAAMGGFVIYKIVHTIMDIAESCLVKQKPVKQKAVKQKAQNKEKSPSMPQKISQKAEAAAQPPVVKRGGIRRITVAT